MKGVGSYPDWSYYAPPPPPNSNLSAFAAPFSVNPYSSSDVSAESAETVSPIHSQSYGYDFLSTPVREIDSSARFPNLGLSSYGGRSSLVEAQPYHPSYSAIHDHSSSVAPYHWSLDWPSLSDSNKSPTELGFSAPNAASWDQFPEFNNRAGEKRFGVWSTLPPKETNAVGLVLEERTNQNHGNQDVKDSAMSEVSHMIDWEKHNLLANGNHLHDTSSCWGTIKPIPVELSGSCVMQSSIMSLETHPDAPLKVSADSMNNHLSNTGSYVQPSRVDTVSSIPGAGLVTDLNIENIIADEHVEHNSFCNTKESYHMPSPGTTGSCFDTGHLRMHLGRNEPSSSNKSMISDNDVSMDVVDYIFRGRDGFQNPHANMDNLSLRLSAVEDVNFAEKPFESGDRCNPAEDSPCWKGASAAHFSCFEPSVALPPHYVHKEEGFGSVIQDPQNYLLDTEKILKKSCEITSSVSSPRKFSLKKIASKDCKSGGVVNDGPFQAKPSSDFGLQQFLDVIKMKEMKKNCVKPAKSIDCESGSSHTEHQVVEENKLMSQKQHISCTDDADAGCNVNKCLESGTSCTAKSALPSSLLVTPENSTGKVSTERLNVQMLVDTMQNLSELLLNHCLNDACELKDRDCNVLKDVIRNLNTCALKNAEQIAPSQESLFNQPETSKNGAGESHEFLQNASLKKPELTKIGPASSKVEFENPYVAFENLHFRFGKPHRNLSDSVSPRIDTEMTETDKATKDLKRILMENFDDDDEGAEPQIVLYKNLWLEAEAALCSVNYRARYHQMKIEMDKYFCKAKENKKQTQSEVVPTLSQSQSTAAEVHNYSDPDSVSLKLAATDMETPNSMTPEGKGNYSDPDSTALKLAALDASTILEELSRLNLSTDMKRPNTMTPEGKGGQNPDSFINDYALYCSDKEAETNNEASVMARYQVLKARGDHQCVDTTNQEPLEISEKSAPGGMDNQNHVNLCQDSSIPENSRIDYAASVVARFHILKSRIEGSSSISSEGTLLDGVEFAGKVMDDITIAKNISGGEIHANPAVAHLNSYAALEKSIPKKFHKDLEDSQEIQPCEAWEFQIPTFHSDGFSSDWEHVEKSL